MNKKILNTQVEGLVEDVLTKEQQDGLTPARVRELLEEGNARFVAGEVTLRNHKEQVRRSAVNQFPKAIVLSCIDSRVPVEDVFDRGIGDLFVARVAGNFVNTDILGSMEFACKVAGAKYILVMGHAHCGAVRSAIDGVELGNITALLSNIKPAVEGLSDYPKARTSANEEFVNLVTEKNVRMSIENIRRDSSILREMEVGGKIGIAGAIYDMTTGGVRFLGETPRS